MYAGCLQSRYSPNTRRACSWCISLPTRSRERFRRLANGAFGTATLRRLLQRQRQAAQIQADDQAVLLAAERQHGAALVGEDNGLRAPPDGGAGAALGVDPGDIRRTANIADGAMEVVSEAPKVKP